MRHSREIDVNERAMSDAWQARRLQRGMAEQPELDMRPRIVKSTNAPAPQVEHASFDGFWEQYPRKRGKADALKAWKKIPLTQDILNAMAAAIDAQSRTKQWREGFIPYPGTWLRGRRWEDELTSADFYRARL